MSGVLGEAVRLEPDVAELAHEEPERNAVLESQRNGRRERVHHAAERASRLGHDDEDLARVPSSYMPTVR
mgnify:CR=1 FL=1